MKNGNRPNAQARGYDNEWMQLQKQYLQVNPYCARCGSKADMVDHRIPIRERPDLRLEVLNLESMCWPCHNVKTKRKDQGQRSGLMPDTNIDGWPLDPDHPWNKKV